MNFYLKIKIFFLKLIFKIFLLKIWFWEKDGFIKTDDVTPNGLFKKQTIIWKCGKLTEINRRIN